MFVAPCVHGFRDSFILMSVSSSHIHSRSLFIPPDRRSFIHSFIHSFTHSNFPLFSPFQTIKFLIPGEFINGEINVIDPKKKI